MITTTTIIFITALYTSTIYVTTKAAQLISREKPTRDDRRALTLILLLACILWGIYFNHNITK